MPLKVATVHNSPVALYGAPLSPACVNEEAVYEPHSTPTWRPGLQSMAWDRCCIVMHTASPLVLLPSEGHFPTWYC